MAWKCVLCKATAHSAPCDRDCVGSVIRLGGFVEVEQKGEHFLYLAFICIAASRDRPFNFKGREFRDGDTQFRKRGDERAARFAHYHGGFRVCLKVQFFNSRAMGAVGSDEFAEPFAQDKQARCGWLVRFCGNASPTDIFHSSSLGGNECVAGRGEAGVDTEGDHNTKIKIKEYRPA